MAPYIRYAIPIAFSGSNIILNTRLLIWFDYKYHKTYLQAELFKLFSQMVTSRFLWQVKGNNL